MAKQNNAKAAGRKGSKAQEVEPLVAEWLGKVKVDPSIRRAIKKGSKLATGRGTCSPEALQLLVELCSFPRKHADYYAKNNTYEHENLPYLAKDRKGSGPGGDWVLGAEWSKPLVKPRDTGAAIFEIASWLDRDALSKRLEGLFFKDGLELALVALALFGNDATIRRLTAEMPGWESYTLYGYRGRRDISIARGAMMFNSSPEVVAYFASVRVRGKAAEKRSLLSYYAELHGTTEDALRDQLASAAASDADDAEGASS